MIVIGRRQSKSTIDANIIGIDIFLKKKENYILCETRKSVGIGTEAKKNKIGALSL